MESSIVEVASFKINVRSTSSKEEYVTWMFIGPFFLDASDLEKYIDNLTKNVKYTFQVDVLRVVALSSDGSEINRFTLYPEMYRNL